MSERYIRNREELALFMRSQLGWTYYSEVNDKYNESHRYYHNWNHILTMAQDAEKEGWLTDHLLVLAIIYHDVVYDPQASDNEEKSAELFAKHFDHPEVVEAILSTKHHNPTTELGKKLCDLDLRVLTSDFGTFMEFENGIFKEYQFVDYKTYKEKRIEILQSLGVAEHYIDYVRNRKVNIGLYAGSFNPFHKGHMNILEKAEQIFDKVIIAKGQNPDKPHVEFDPPSQIKNRQIIQYDCMMTDLIKIVGDVTLIRGLRNATDFSYETTQHRYMQDFMPNLKSISILCDKQYDHISSSGVRYFNSIDRGHDYEL